MADDVILYEVRDAIGVLTLNRPQALNALNLEMMEEIAVLTEHLRNDETVRVLVITGAGDKAFAAGADIGGFSRMDHMDARQFITLGQETFFKIEQLPLPVIACVNGFALGGGCELALSCDFIFAADNARFGQPEVNLGLIPGAGGTQRLTRLVGRAKAKELCMTGEMIDAQEAKELGLVAKVFPADRLMEETLAVARFLTTRSRLALRSIKQVIDRGLDMDFKNACANEARAFGNCFASADAREGITAFLEKREPRFQ